MNTIKWGAKEFLVPDGFEKVLPETFAVGDLAYIVGTYEGRPWAYGPFTVVSIEDRLLKGPRGQFCDRSSHWLIKGE